MKQKVCLFNFFLEATAVKEKVVIVGFYKRLNEILPQIKRIYSIETIFCPTAMKEQNKCLVVDSNASIISEVSDLKNIVTSKKITSIILSLDFYSNEDLVKKSKIIPLCHSRGNGNPVVF